MAGALSTTLIIALFAGTALHPPLPRRSTPFSLPFAITWWINEAPVLGLWWLALGTWETLRAPQHGPWWWVVAALTALDVALLARLLLRGRTVRPVLAAALRDAYGPAGEPPRSRVSWWRILLVPFLSWRPDVRRLRGRRYGPGGGAHRLDVVVPRRPPAGPRPVLVYFHGGGFVMGSKALGGRPLLNRLAAQGWVCVSANYRLRGATYAERLDDTRSVLQWVREHAEELGADPGAVLLSGGSAGAHLAAMTALVGEEVDDVGVRGVVGMYGYYGAVDHSLPSGTDVGDNARPDAPPFLLLHGAQDTLVRKEDVRELATRLRTASTSPVVHAEPPGTNHNFDFFPSLRWASVGDAVDRFVHLALGGGRPAGRQAVGSSRKTGMSRSHRSW